MMVNGGDTLLALCQAAGVHRLAVTRAPAAGWGQARWLGGPRHGVRCLSRSGAFGGPDDLARAVSSLAP